MSCHLHRVFFAGGGGGGWGDTKRDQNKIEGGQMRLSGLQRCKQFGRCSEIFLLSKIRMDGIIGRTSIIQFMPL